MAEIKWIKVAADVFDDEKILLIKAMPKSDTLLVIWFELLCFAGKQNNSGVLMMNTGMAYTSKMLASIFKRSEKAIKDALKIFEDFGMVKTIDGVITIPNWGKHQNLDQLENKKAYMKGYMKEYREKQKNLAGKTNSKPDCKTNSKTNVSQTERELYKQEKESLIERDNIYNNTAHTREEKNGYGQFKNVFLSDEEMAQLKTMYADYEERINKLSVYIKSSGKAYDSHYATIIKWANEDAAKQKKQQNKKTAFNNFSGEDNISDFEKREIQKRMKSN